MTEYADAVIDGSIPACQLVQAACSRHLYDLQDANVTGFWFDDEAASNVLRFFSLLPHVKGEWAKNQGKIVLQPWQKFIIGSLFGWKRADGMRRFRTAYIEVPRKNAKSTLGAGIALWLAFADGEPGAEVYCAATKRDQAKICWGDARQMVLKTPALLRRITCYVGNLHDTSTHSKFEPLGADADSMDGLNIHGAIVDELHAHQDRRIVDVLETATGARRQPLIVYITTAGYDRQSVCWEKHYYAAQVARLVIDDDSLFSYIATIDVDDEGKGDDWRQRSSWIKANPNYGISVNAEKMATDARRAQMVPAEQNAFKRLYLNIWTQQESRWMDAAKWQDSAGSIDAVELDGRQCHAGLDLASTVDVTALALVFPDDVEPTGYDVIMRFWMPKDTLLERVRQDKVPYDVWVDQGLIIATEGNVVDYDVVKQTIYDLAAQYQIVDIRFDPWNATQITTELAGEGLNMIQMRQGFVSLSDPMKQVMNLVLAKRLRHGNNPVLSWMADNVVVSTDPAGNIKPNKQKSQQRIDGIVALIMALDGALRSENRSVYDDEGVFVI